MGRKDKWLKFAKHAGIVLGVAGLVVLLAWVFNCC